MEKKYIKKFALITTVLMSQIILFQGQTWAIVDQKQQPEPPIIHDDPPPNPVVRRVVPVYTADDYASWADDAYNRGDFGNAFNNYYTAAEMGHTRARYQLATMYQEGRGTVVNLDKAAWYYSLAADKGYAKAMLKLGLCQLNGWGVPVQLDKAADNFRKAVAGGENEAAGYLRELEENKQKAEAMQRATEAQLKREAEERAMRLVAKAIKPAMNFVAGGTFTMGDTFGGGYDDEKPTHQVQVNNFYMGKYEVTFAEYDVFCEATGRQKPSDEGFGRGQHPVIHVSWYDAIAYCNWLSSQEGLTAVYSGSGDNVQCNFNTNGYRLPTEAEWEYAARGGNNSGGYKYSGSNNAADVAWYEKNSGYSTHQVGQKQGNELGLYDMSGNVYEWCWDWYGYYRSGDVNNPLGVNLGSSLVLRGGSWYRDASDVRSASRYYSTPGNSSYSIGFRLVRTP